MTKYLVRIPGLDSFYVDADEVKIREGLVYTFYVNEELVCACPLTAIIERDQN